MLAQRPVRTCLGLAVLGAALVTTSCSGASSSGSSGAATTTDLASANVSGPGGSGPPTASPAGADADLNQIGTLTETGKGWSASVTLSLGTVTPPGSASLPQGALDGCNWNYHVVLATTPFVHGKAVITYTGSIPQPVLFTMSQSLRVPPAQVALCSSTDGAGYSQTADPMMDPNTTQTLDLWLALPGVTNEHPTFDPKDEAIRAFFLDRTSLYVGTDTQFNVTSTGAGAAHCTADNQPPEDGLLVFNRPPTTIAGWVCTPPKAS